MSIASFLIKLFGVYYIFVNHLFLIHYHFELNKPKHQASLQLLRIVPRYDRHLRTCTIIRKR